MSNPMLSMFGLPGGMEWVIIGGIALLIFGRRLPDVARSIGKSIVEFKRGLRDVKDDLDTQSRLDSNSNSESKSTPPLENKSEPANHETQSSRSDP